MLTIESARQHLREVTAELARLDKDREALVGLVRNYEDFLRLRTAEVPTTANEDAIVVLPGLTEQMAEVKTQRTIRVAPRRRKAKKMSKRDAALLVIRAQNGAEIHALEIAKRINEYVTHKLNPKHPYASRLDYQLSQLREQGLIEKIPGKNAWKAVPAA
ncbi:MAG TPA: hypothetical protein VME66_02065 [Candidatus Acidoferrales bacterium]|nr:hypothetical protein [Candidatus Acidoferrales bacterium]